MRLAPLWKKERHQSFLSATLGHGRKADIWKSVKRAITRNWSCWQLESSPRLPELWEINVCCLSHPVSGTVCVQAKTSNNNKFPRIIYTIWETFSLWLHHPHYYWFEPLHSIDYGKLSILPQGFFFFPSNSIFIYPHDLSASWFYIPSL